MKYFLTIFIFAFGIISLFSEDETEQSTETKAPEARKIPPKIQIMIDRIKQLSEDEAFEDLDRTIKMGNKIRMQVLLHVYPQLKNRKDTFGRTPLYNAVFAEHPELVKFLLNKRANFATPNVDGDTPLHRAAAGGSSEIIKLLIGKGALYYTKNKKGRTALFNAAINGEIEAATLLLKAGDNVNRLDKYGDTPLHFAALKGNTEMVKFLLENKADLKIKNKKGKTPADIAKIADIKKLLIK